MIPADVGSVGGYNVGYNECSRTTHFVTAPGRLDIAIGTSVSEAMVPPDVRLSTTTTASAADATVPPADNQLKNTYF